MGRRRGARYRWARTGGFVRGVAIGAVVAYLFDPDRGSRRRAELRDRGRAEVRQLVRRAERRAYRARDEARGSLHELTHPPHVPGDDRTLGDIVRSRVLGRPAFHGLPLNVDVVGGVVTLRGEVPRRQLGEELTLAVHAVPGVRGVRNLLHLPGEPAPNKEAALNHA